jgi:hypothetical protein
VETILEELKMYIVMNPKFENIGSKMCETLEVSLGVCRSTQ